MQIRLLISVFLLSVVSGALAGCSKQPETPSTEEGPIRVPVRFDVVSRGTETRGAVSGAGDAVGSLDLLVFRASDGMLDTYKRLTTGALTVEAEVTSGRSMHWWIIANAPSGVLSVFQEESVFLSALTRLEDTGSTAMVMHAEGTKTFTASANSVSSALVRYASKVSIKDVTVEWLDDFAYTPSCRLQTVALVNAVGTTPYSGTPTAPAASGAWFNRSSVETTLTTAQKAFLVWDAGQNIPSSATVTPDVELYAMPNPCTTELWATDTPWSPRRTRIAVELVIDGASNWYSVELPAMEGNTHYQVRNLIIRGPGMSAPDNALERSSVSFTVDVVDWDDNPLAPVFGVDD